MGIVVVGLGPSGLDRVASETRDLLRDEGRRVILRTIEHPAAAELASLRPVESGDRFYDASDDFDSVYQAIADAVVAAGRDGDVVYAVPGSARVAERAVGLIVAMADAAGIPCRVVGGESFVDAALGVLELDPLERGLQVLDGRNLPHPLPLHVPTLIAQVDGPLVLGDVATALGKTLRGETEVILLDDLGGGEERVVPVPLADLARQPAGPRTTLFLDPPPTGWHGLVTTNRTLRRECPWDRKQTHHSLVKHLVEEAYETVEALSALPPDAPGGEPDFGLYAELEEELGDLLLQVVFHATLAAEVGAFDVEEVAEGIRRKLVNRHPHVFGDIEADDADTVMENWERLKRDEKGRASLLDGVPVSLPALARAASLQQRAASVGFDWPDTALVLDKLAEETAELRTDLSVPERASEEVGDVLFTAVNLARHLAVDPELALRRAADRFDARFRAMEAAAGTSLGEMSLEELDRLWDAAKGE